MSWNQIFAVLGALAIVVGIAVWLLKKWAVKPEPWESKIPPPPANLQTEEMKPAEMPPPPVPKGPPPVYPTPKQEQRRK
jgi:hypothetical protein